MNINEIKKAVQENKKVFWKNNTYQVTMDHLQQFFIYNPSCNYFASYLTRQDGTLNGKEYEFFISR